MVEAWGILSTGRLPPPSSHISDDRSPWDDFNTEDMSCHLHRFLGVFVCAFWFLGPHTWHMEVPRLGIKSEL